jgi:rhodanese-related sulfurtransferase
VSIPEIDIEELDARRDTIVLIDVRQPDEYEGARIDGALLIPLPDLPERVEEISDDVEVAVICGSGPRSARAVEFLLRQGFEAANVVGGMKAWAEAGKPITSGPVED